MRKLKSLGILLLAVCAVLCASSCKEDKVIANPKPENVIESFFAAWEKSDVEAIASLTCEPMWEIEAKSAEISTEELKIQIKEAYSQESGSKVYYKILETKEYTEESKEFKTAYKWAKDRYKIDIEGYATVRVAVTYDDGEPVMQNMEVIKYEKSWYAKDLLGI